MGDLLYALPSVRALGGGEIYMVTRPWTRTRWGPQILSVIKPLIDATGYATLHLHDDEWIDYDFSCFRHGGYRLGDTILERQRRWVGAEAWDGRSSWLKAQPVSVAPVVINRAGRWHGFDFPWRAIIETFSGDAVFIGLRQEHEAFTREFGPVFFVPTGDLLEAAEVIQGAELFIGNQSACNSIANGLGKRIVLEVCPYGPDCFLRADTFYSFNGEAKIEAAGRKLELSPRSEGRYQTEVGGRMLYADDLDKLRVLARGYHAYNGTFAFYDEVEVAYG